VLRVERLSLAYDEGTPVLDEVSLAIDAGRFISLVGPSGSGKSSLLRAVMGLQRPASGHIESELGARDIGILFQDDALLPWRSAAANVALGLRLRGDSRARATAQAESWLTRLGLAGLGDRYPRALSGGQRKRVALAQVLALKPRLLLMDEPFASLDAITRARVTQDLLALVEAERMTVLLVTHDLEEALALSDVVYLLSHGPRARISRRYEVPIPRPRDVVAARTHPAFAPLLEALWRDLSREVAAEAAA
jgi:NitT/TauT family transport system ATP-binding protein